MTQAEAATVKHHPDCDGWRMHHVRAQVQRHEFGAVTWIPWCDSCEAPVPNVDGSASSPETAIGLGRHHDMPVECQGECEAWLPECGDTEAPDQCACGCSASDRCEREVCPHHPQEA